MPDDGSTSSHVSLRVPDDVIEAFDRIAELLERPRSWVMVRALRQYLAGEGGELIEDATSLAQLDRGEGVPFETVLDEVDAIVGKRKAKRAPRR
jgi:predicted transcriptional regulator